MQFIIETNENGEKTFKFSFSTQERCDEFISDEVLNEWEQSTPPTLVIFHIPNDVEIPYGYVKEEDICPK